MDRRQFCKIGALALGALGAGSLKGMANVCVASNDGDTVLTRACRLTVMRRECYEDIQALYLDDPETGPCDTFATGDEWVLGKGECCPKGFCLRAWRSVAAAVNAQSSCVEGVRDVFIVACPDGTRPGVFRVEIMSEPVLNA